jgi:DUF1365 family protein
MAIRPMRYSIYREKRDAAVHIYECAARQGSRPIDTARLAICRSAARRLRRSFSPLNQFWCHFVHANLRENAVALYVHVWNQMFSITDLESCAENYELWK